MSITFDPDAAGRQFGAVCVALDRANASGGPSDRLEIPVAVIGRGEGAVITLVGRSGSPSAMQVISALMRSLDAQRVQGRIQLIPTLCPTVLRAASVSSPDGIAAASLSSVTVDALDHHLLRRSTLVLALGAPSVQRWSDTAAIGSLGERCAGTPGAEAALVAFGAPFSLRRETGAGDGLALPFSRHPAPGAHDDAGSGARDSIATRCRTAGIDLLEVFGHAVAGRDGGSDRLQAGVCNVLVQAGVLDAPFTLRASQALRLASATEPLRAPCTGWLQQRARPGESVHRGDVLALIHDPERPHRPPVPVEVPSDGVLLSARREGRVWRGDELATVAEPVSG